MSFRSTLVAITITATTLLVAPLAVPATQATTEQDNVIAAIAARQTAKQAYDELIAAEKELKNLTAEADNIAATIDYGTAGETFNAGVAELNELVPELGLPKIGEPGGPIAANSFAATNYVELGYRPFALEEHYDHFQAKVGDAYRQAGAAAISALIKVNGTRDDMKKAVQPYYDALEKNKDAIQTATTKVRDTGTASIAAEEVAEKIDTTNTLKTFKAQSLARIAADLKTLETRLADNKTPNNHSGSQHRQNLPQHRQNPTRRPFRRRHPRSTIRRHFHRH